MADELVHRGPDGEGVWIEGPVGFAHRRLSIIDLAGSPQPMASHDSRFHVAFNGEILNYRQLRSGVDYPFRTEGDTEVVLAAFGARGPQAAESFRGQFAFAVYDSVQRRLCLVRDRLGILPLYYWSDGSQLAFASEIKALLPALPRTPSIDRFGLEAYLAHRSVPAPDTLFEGIRKLPPGHCLTAQLDGAVTVAKWWSVPEVADESSVTDDEAVERVRSALDESVRLNLVADVPVGAYLSGGVDSSLIVALMARHKDPRSIHTFSAGFGDARLDETAHARRVSEHVGTVHHQVVVTADDFERLWGRLTWHRDAPVSEPADIAVFRLAELARREVKVVLSGEGSDELFAGYPKYRFARASVLAGALPAPLQRLGALLDHTPVARLSKARIALRALTAGDHSAVLEGWFAPFSVRERSVLLRSPTRPAGAAMPKSAGDGVRRMLYADCHAWLADNLLERGDRMSMAASLELRPPFLDVGVVDTAFRLPSDLKVRGGCTKWVVKQVAGSLLPADIVHRPKSGFRVPLARWFRGSLAGLARDRLLDPNSFVTQVFDRSAVRRLLERHSAARTDEEIRLWTLLSLEVWHDEFFRRTRARPSSNAA
jgi:asparagine synthase (glutamine-hydrolysing)